MLPVLQEVPGNYRWERLWDSTRGGQRTIADAWAWGRQAHYLSWLEISHSISRLLAFAWYWRHFTGLRSDSNCHEIWSDKGSGTSWGSCSSTQVGWTTTSLHCTVCTLGSRIAPCPRIFGVFLESGLSPFIKVVRWPWFSFLTYQENKPFFARFQSYLVSKPRKISEI